MSPEGRIPEHCKSCNKQPAWPFKCSCFFFQSPLQCLDSQANLHWNCLLEKCWQSQGLSCIQCPVRQEHIILKYQGFQLEHDLWFVTDHFHPALWHVARAPLWVPPFTLSWHPALDILAFDASPKREHIVVKYQAFQLEQDLGSVISQCAIAPTPTASWPLLQYTTSVSAYFLPVPWHPTLVPPFLQTPLFGAENGVRVCVPSLVFATDKLVDSHLVFTHVATGGDRDQLSPSQNHPLVPRA